MICCVALLPDSSIHDHQADPVAKQTTRHGTGNLDRTARGRSGMHGSWALYLNYYINQKRRTVWSPTLLAVAVTMILHNCLEN